MEKAISNRDLLKRKPVPPERLLRQYEPDAKTIFGRVWSDPIRGVMKARNGKEYPTTYIKVFVYRSTEKYRCTFRFEQAIEALDLKKGDNVLLSGVDTLTETVKSHKRYHNFAVTKFFVLNNGYEAENIRQMGETYDALIDAYAERAERIEACEKALRLRGSPLPEPKGDSAKGLKKRQSLSAVVGDIYAGLTDDDRRIEE